jgi:hypothetical protein
MGEEGQELKAPHTRVPVFRDISDNVTNPATDYAKFCRWARSQGRLQET